MPGRVQMYGLYPISKQEGTKANLRGRTFQKSYCLYNGVTPTPKQTEWHTTSFRLSRSNLFISCFWAVRLNFIHPLWVFKLPRQSSKSMVAVTAQKVSQNWIMSGCFFWKIGEVKRTRSWISGQFEADVLFYLQVKHQNQNRCDKLMESAITVDLL